MSKVKRNLGYQTFYQVLITCLPLITSPYLSRVLGSGKLGIFSYTNSIVSYFTLFAMLGVISYGTRTIATCKDNKVAVSQTFWEIYLFQLSSSIICSILYVAYCMFFCKENHLVAILQGINLLAAFCDINWLFFGVEDFKVTVTRNAIIKIVAVILILFLVKSSSDLWIYTFIMTSSTFISNLVLWKFAGKYISFSHIKQVNKSGISKHIKPNLVLFIPLAAMHIYHVMDKTMLGAISTYNESGFYYNADKVVSIPVGIINGFGTALLPRISSLVGSGEKKKSDDYFLLSIKVIAMISIAMAFGIAAISNEFVPLFFGDGFDSCIFLIILLSPILIIKGYCYVARMLYLIPNHLEKVYIGSVIFGAIVNLFANAYFIPNYGAVGAVLGTVLAELLSCVLQYILMYKYIKYAKSLLKSFVYLLFGFVMFFLVRLSANVFSNMIIGLLFEILIGVISFSFMSIIYFIITKNSTYYSIKESLLNKISKK